MNRESSEEKWERALSHRVISLNQKVFGKAPSTLGEVTLFCFLEAEVEM